MKEGVSVSFYAVKRGKVTGIYRTWDECKKNTDGFPKAVFKKFLTSEEAESYMDEPINEPREMNEEEVHEFISDPSVTYSFIDGSCNPATMVYGYGGYIRHEGKRHYLQGSGKDEEMIAMRNIAGELLGSVKMVDKALELGIKKISVFYDYVGIEMWATGRATRKTRIQSHYYNLMQEAMKAIDIEFIKVKAHIGIEGNELVDRLAKEAVGVIDTKELDNLSLIEA